jgi:hypothetical protein
LISTGNRPCVIGFRGWSTHHMQMFWIDFAAAMFAKNAGELYLVGDEFHNFAPKGKVLSPQAGESLHWSNRLLSEGRGLGLVCLLASQRPQKVHNDTLTSCETLVAMRVIHKADRDAVKDWIDGAGDPKLGSEVLNSLASMPRGEAYVWSPEVGFGPKRIAFPMFETFDSFAPPQLQKRVSTKGWADIDLVAVKEKLAAVIEEHRANDPTELKKQNADLRRENEKLLRARPTPVKEREKVVEVSSKRDLATIAKLRRGLEDAMKVLAEISAKGFDVAGVDPEVVKKAVEGAAQMIVKAAEQKIARQEGEFARLKKEMQKALAGMQKLIGETDLSVRVDVKHNEPFTVQNSPAPRAARTPRPEGAAGGDSDASLPSGERAVLSAVAQFQEGIDKTSLAVMTGYKTRTRNDYLKRLKDKGFIELRGDQAIATEEGVTALGSDFEHLPVGDALREHWLPRLPSGERRLLEILIEHHPEAVPRDSLDEPSGFAARTRNDYLSRLSARKLVEPVGSGEVKASDLLFG